jgi:aspartyl-tRNA(Asn)/glutamyl-tRNA(Gln) amidotransferase subunit B
MEEGSFRCDANISVRSAGSTEFGAKVEVKNMNSFKAVRLAMEYEAQRQRKAAAEGKRLVQETRGWVEAQGKTVSQRSKEYAHDYRYFPEPDLPPLVIGRDWVEAVRKKLPELPEARRDRFINEYNMTPSNADLLTKSWGISASGDELVQIGIDPNTASNWLLGEVSHIMNEYNIEIDEFKVKVSMNNLAELIRLNQNNVINTTTSKSVLGEMFKTAKTAAEIIKDRGLSQISDTSELEKIVAEVIKSNIQPVADYRAGKETALKFLVGQVMKATKGRANPQVVNEVLKRKLAESS